MITIDDNMKQRLSRLLDSDGKIMISDDMPDDLKAAIRYLNANDINLLSENDPLADDPEIDTYDESDADDSVEVDTSLIETVDDTDEDSFEAVDIDEDEDIETDDLEDLF